MAGGLRYHEGMRFGLLTLFGAVTLVAVVIRIAIVSPEFAALFICGFPVTITLLVCILIGIICPMIALVRWLRSFGPTHFSPPSSSTESRV